MLGKQLPIPDVASPDISKQNNRFTCINCRIKFESAELQRNHFKTGWHLYNLKRKVCELEPIELSAFLVIQATPSKQDDETSEAGSTYSDLWSRRRTEHIDKPDDVKESDEDDDEEDEWEFLDEDYEEEELDDLMSQVIQPDTCLICDKKSASCKRNVEHMDEAHGLFIPESRFLIDLEGLLEYLGFKVGAGATCLWCNKQFTTLHGVRLHMLYKSHCKIFFDHEKAVTEFKEFYDYSGQETFEVNPRGCLNVATMGPTGRRIRQSRALARSYSSTSDQQQIDAKLQKATRSLEKKSTKKFQAYRAKIALRSVVNGNWTLRHRFRAQNPI